MILAPISLSNAWKESTCSRLRARNERWCSPARHGLKWSPSGAARSIPRADFVRMNPQPEAAMALYDTIGIGYDTTRAADPYLVSRLLSHLRPCAGALYLDVGCGTGNYTGAFTDAGVRIVGVDYSREMLARAHSKRPALALYRGRAEALPFRSSAFAGATCTFVHHHMDDPVAALREVARVLAPGARLVLLNGTVEQMRHHWLWEYFPKALAKAIAPYQRFETADALAVAGFRIETLEPYEVRDDLRDLFLYAGKNRPEIYLDSKVRSGISFFAAAPDRDEVEAGVARLRADIASGRIDEVRRPYAWDGGDYMITVAVR
jgi:ubiquinone/menaquinone biosynthesis C-methylase UbiE